VLEICQFLKRETYKKTFKYPSKPGSLADIAEKASHDVTDDNTSDYVSKDAFCASDVSQDYDVAEDDDVSFPASLDVTESSSDSGDSSSDDAESDDGGDDVSSLGDVLDNVANNRTVFADVTPSADLSGATNRTAIITLTSHGRTDVNNNVTGDADDNRNDANTCIFVTNYANNLQGIVANNHRLVSV
jgi:hypothetical protein